MGANEGDIHFVLEFVTAGEKERQKGRKGEDGKRDKEDVSERKKDRFFDTMCETVGDI